jgi:hypothetical protein
MTLGRNPLTNVRTIAFIHPYMNPKIRQEGPRGSNNHDQETTEA